MTHTIVKKIGFILSLLYIFSTGFALFDFHYSDQSGNEYQEEDSNERANNNAIGKKIYLPQPEKIYKDAYGQYFYMPSKKKNDMGGSGGFYIQSYSLSNAQNEILQNQLNFATGISGNISANFPLIGGGGYWHANKNFYLGGRGAGGIMTVGTGSNRLKYSIGYGGLDFLVLMPFISNDFNFILGCLIGAGGIEMDSKITAKYKKTFWLLEPKVGMQYNISSFFCVRAFASYLYSQDINSEVEGTLGSFDFDTSLSQRNYTAAVVFEWGSF